MCYFCYFDLIHYNNFNSLQQDKVFDLEPEIKHINSFVNNELLDTNLFLGRKRPKNQKK